MNPNAHERLTPQRRAVYTALTASCDHPTAATLHDRAREHYPGLSVATVYNVLKWLVERGMAIELAAAGGPSRYDGTVSDHGHIVCRRCGAMADWHQAEAAATVPPSGWDVAVVRVIAEGVCPSCRPAPATAVAH